MGFLTILKRMSVNNYDISSSTQLPTDLSKYHIIKKFDDGWLVGSILTGESMFLPKEHLIKIGYLSQESEDIFSKSYPFYNNVIFVPTGKEKQQNVSKADLDVDWRKSKLEKSNK